VLDTVLQSAAKTAAVSALTRYNAINNAANLAAYQGGNMPEIHLPDGAVYVYEGEIEMSSVYRTVNLSKAAREAAAKESAEIGRVAGENVRKAMERAKTAPVVKALRDQAQVWADKGQDRSLDHEIRALYLRKAAAAEAEAEAIEAGEGRDSEEARRLDADAVEHDKRATDTRLSPDIRRYYADQARASRDAARRARGLPVHEEDKPVNREISFRI
jgi:hypothetical protein